MKREQPNSIRPVLLALILGIVGAGTAYGIVITQNIGMSTKSWWGFISFMLFVLSLFAFGEAAHFFATWDRNRTKNFASILGTPTPAVVAVPITLTHTLSIDTREEARGFGEIRGAVHSTMHYRISAGIVKALTGPPGRDVWDTSLFCPHCGKSIPATIYQTTVVLLTAEEYSSRLREKIILNLIRRGQHGYLTWIRLIFASIAATVAIILAVKVWMTISGSSLGIILTLLIFATAWLMCQLIIGPPKDLFTLLNYHKSKSLAIEVTGPISAFYNHPSLLNIITKVSVGSGHNFQIETPTYTQVTDKLGPQYLFSKQGLSDDVAIIGRLESLV